MSKPSMLTQMSRMLSLAGLEPTQDGRTIVSRCPSCAHEETQRPLSLHVNGAGPEITCANGCDGQAILAAIKARSDQTNGADVERAALDTYRVTWTDEKIPKLVLPAVPEHTDTVGLCAWLTRVFNLDTSHPVTGAAHEGPRGPDGHVEVRRAGTAAIRFEPASRVNTARGLHGALEWELLPTDGELYGFKDEHARRIAHVLRMLCGASRAPSEAQETASIIGTFLQGAEAIEGHTTHGTSGQRYEAAQALRREDERQSGRPWGQPRYLIDTESDDTENDELVIRVSDLQATARTQIGSSLARGWLDARIDNLGWRRQRLDGHGQPGRAGRQGPHARIDVYAGPWPVGEITDDE